MTTPEEFLQRLENYPVLKDLDDQTASDSPFSEYHEPMSEPFHISSPASDHAHPSQYPDDVTALAPSGSLHTAVDMVHHIDEGPISTSSVESVGECLKRRARERRLTKLQFADVVEINKAPLNDVGEAGDEPTKLHSFYQELSLNEHPELVDKKPRASDKASQYCDEGLATYGPLHTHSYWFKVKDAELAEAQNKTDYRNAPSFYFP